MQAICPLITCVPPYPPSLTCPVSQPTRQLDEQGAFEAQRKGRKREVLDCGGIGVSPSASDCQKYWPSEPTLLL